VTRLVGTGTSGYNGNGDRDGNIHRVHRSQAE
jgi:hypothetical protein